MNSVQTHAISLYSNESNPEHCPHDYQAVQWQDAMARCDFFVHRHYSLSMGASIEFAEREMRRSQSQCPRGRTLQSVQLIRG